MGMLPKDKAVLASKGDVPMSLEFAKLAIIDGTLNTLVIPWIIDLS